MVTDDGALADRLALRELVETYAHCVDRRDAPLLDSLFVDDAELLVFDDLTATEPARALRGREELARITRSLKRYVATTHFIGNHRVELAGDTATGETYCLAHHIYDGDSGVRRLLVWSIRYQDRYVRHEGAWRFAQRRLLVDWQDDRAITAGERLQR
jgi:SnoaL-like domain